MNTSTLMSILKVGVFLSLAVSLVLLGLLVLGISAFGRRRLHTRPQGRSGRGVVYALGRGLLPWEKESAAKHLPTYTAGMTYHTGIFTSFLFVLLTAAAVRLPAIALMAARALMGLGLISGLGLLIKRISKPKLRHISSPDDYIANSLVDAFLLSGVAATFYPGVVPIYFAVAILMFLYMPLGKIRHCVFFFLSRIRFGSYFGRRGVLPPAKRTMA
jgi:hypothetical protein